MSKTPRTDAAIVAIQPANKHLEFVRAEFARQLELELQEGKEIHDPVIFGGGHKSVFLQSHRIGTCGEPIDQLTIELGRVRAVPRLIVAFDGVRNGWSIGGSFRNAEGDDFEFRELQFIPEQDFNEDRFRGLCAS